MKKKIKENLVEEIVHERKRNEMKNEENKIKKLILD